jgi:HEAT repeat protein
VEVARELTEYTSEEMEVLRSMGEVGSEADIIEAAVRTLIFLIPMVRRPGQAEPAEKEVHSFSGVIHQLETILTFLLKAKDYDLATIVVRAYHLPVDDVFQPRLAEAIKKAGGREVISGVVNNMRASQKGSPEYLAAYNYLSVLDQEATTVLFETLAVEKDRAIRRYLIDILKELGRSQISKIGQRIGDSRWYVVRNVVNILAESRSEEALPYLEKVIGHKQLQIRHEVMKGLVTIGGKRAAGIMARFLSDKDIDVQLAAVKMLAIIFGAGPEEARALESYLAGQPVKSKHRDFLAEGIRSLGKIGDQKSVEFLERYRKIRWWKPRKLQLEVRDHAESAIGSIQGRPVNG